MNTREPFVTIELTDGKLIRVPLSKVDEVLNSIENENQEESKKSSSK